MQRWIRNWKWFNGPKPNSKRITKVKRWGNERKLSGREKVPKGLKQGWIWAAFGRLVCSVWFECVCVRLLDLIRQQKEGQKRRERKREQQRKVCRRWWWWWWRSVMVNDSDCDGGRGSRALIERYLESFASKSQESKQVKRRRSLESGRNNRQNGRN